MIYYALAIAWILLSVLIGLYINSYKLNGQTHFKVGLLTIGITYLGGVIILVIAILKS